ncbi:MAG TPA: hypothetical protein VGR92_14205 [Steroidobacteraceae bacterium]|nr:hypothetical protein [Steroidobacteraceae bacterium]
MSLIEESDDDVVVEECIEELDELLMSLDRFPPTAVAVAIATYLEGLLGALLDERHCTAGEARELLREIESAVLKEEPPAGR